MSEHNRTQTACLHAGALAPKAHADYTRNHDSRIVPLAVDNDAEGHTKRTQRAVRGVVVKKTVSSGD